MALRTFLIPLLGILILGDAIQAGQAPSWLPHYDLAVRLDPDQRLATVVQRVTWVNRHQRPTRELVFNAHAHYAIPDKDIGLLAKTVEILRMAPSESMSFDGSALEVQRARVFQEGLAQSEGIVGQVSNGPEAPK